MVAILLILVAVCTFCRDILWIPHDELVFCLSTSSRFRPIAFCSDALFDTTKFSKIVVGLKLVALLLFATRTDEDL